MDLLTRRLQSRVGPESFATKPNLALLALPTTISIFTYHYAAALLIASIILVSFISNGNVNNRLKPRWSCAILPAGALLIALRPNSPTTELEVLFFVAVLIAVMRAVYLSNSKACAFISLHDGVGIFLIATVALWFTGFRTGVVYDFGKNFITGGDRILFPLTSTLATAPTMASAYVVAFPVVMMVTRRHRVLRFTAFLAAIYILIQSDRRSALFAVVFITIFVIAARRIFRHIAPFVIGVALTTPILTASFPAASGLSSVVTGLMTPFRRTREDISTLNGRSGIWTNSLQFYEDRIDPFHQLFGYGTWGHVKSGASSTYASLFSGLYRVRASRSPHSTVLQLLFDGGWITAVSFTSVLIGAAWVMARGMSPGHLVGLSMLAAMSFVGATENILAPYLTAVPFWMTAVIVTAALSRECPPPQVGSADSMSKTAIGDGTYGGQRHAREIL